MDRKVRYVINIKRRTPAEIAQLQERLDKEYEESKVYSRMVGATAIRKKVPEFYAVRYDHETGKEDIKELDEIGTKTKFDILCSELVQKVDDTIVRFDSTLTNWDVCAKICKELTKQEVAEMIDFRSSIEEGHRREIFSEILGVAPAFKEVQMVAEYNAKRDDREHGSAEEYKHIALNFDKMHKSKYVGEVERSKNKESHISYEVKKRTPDEMKKLMLEYEKAVAERKQLAASGGAHSYDAYLGDLKRPCEYYVKRLDTATGNISVKDADELDANQAFNVLFGETDGRIDRRTTIDKDARKGLYEELNKNLSYSDIQEIMYKVEDTKLPKSVIDDILSPINKYKEADTIAKFNNSEYSCRTIAMVSGNLSLQKERTKD